MVLYRKRKKSGFTLIKPVVVILQVGILAGIVIPNFIDFRTDAKNAATLEALGITRSTVTIGVSAIPLQEDPTNKTPTYPTSLEMQGNAFDGSHYGKEYCYINTRNYGDFGWFYRQSLGQVWANSG